MRSLEMPAARVRFPTQRRAPSSTARAEPLIEYVCRRAVQAEGARVPWGDGRGTHGRWLTAGLGTGGGLPHGIAPGARLGRRTGDADPDGQRRIRSPVRARA